jgi:hypothetical protein
LADRKPFCAMVLWRQQDDNGIGVIRTAEVRYAGTAVDGPYEQHDLSEFCASENHAVKVGAYIISKRRHVTHRLQLGVKPDAFNASLAPGDLVRVRLDRIASTGASSTHDFLYELDRIGKSVSGDVRLELTHFPVDATNASIVAQEVDAAVGGGILLPTGLTGITCDINSSTDTSVPADTSVNDWVLPGSNAFDFGISNFGNDAFDGGEVSNPSDNLGSYSDGYTYSGDPENPVVGDTITPPDVCEGLYTEWRLVNEATGEYTIVAAGVATPYIATEAAAAAGVRVEGVGRCPDPSAPDGYGEPIEFGPVPKIASGCGGIEGITYNGTVPPPGNTIGAPITLANGNITSQTYNFQQAGCNAAIDPVTTSGASSVTLQNVKDIELVAVPGTCGKPKQLLWRVTYATGVIQDRNITQVGDDRGYALLETSVTVTWDHPSAVTYCP